MFHGEKMVAGLYFGCMSIDISALVDYSYYTLLITVSYSKFYWKRHFTYKEIKENLYKLGYSI